MLELFSSRSALAQSRDHHAFATDQRCPLCASSHVVNSTPHLLPFRFCSRKSTCRFTKERITVSIVLPGFIFLIARMPLPVLFPAFFTCFLAISLLRPARTAIAMASPSFLLACQILALCPFPLLPQGLLCCILPPRFLRSQALVSLLAVQRSALSPRHPLTYPPTAHFPLLFQLLRLFLCAKSCIKRMSRHTNRIILHHTQRPMRSRSHKRPIVTRHGHGDEADGYCS